MNKKRKRVLSLILSAAVMATSIFTTAFAADDEIIYGDANGDKVVSAADASIIMQYTLNQDRVKEKINLLNSKVTTDAALAVSGSSLVVTTGPAIGITVNIDTKDAAAVMQKVLRADFEFIAEGGKGDTEDTTKPDAESTTNAEPSTESTTDAEPSTESTTDAEPSTESTTDAEPSTESTTDAEPDTESTTTNPNNKSWNISDFEVKEATYSEVTEIDGLTLVGSSDKPIVIDANNKELDGITYDTRLKLGGKIDSNLERSNIKFNVSGNCTINIIGISGSKSEDRAIGLYGSDKQQIKLSDKLSGTSGVQKVTFDYTGESDTLAIGSPDGAINIYAIEVLYN